MASLPCGWQRILFNFGFFVEIISHLFTTHTHTPFSVILAGQINDESPPEMLLDSYPSDHDCEHSCDNCMEDGVNEYDGGTDSGADDSDHASADSDHASADSKTESDSGKQSLTPLLLMQS